MRRIAMGLGLILVAALGSGCWDSSSSGDNMGSHGEGGGFVWKPRSESDGRLVALLPPQYRGNVQSAHIADSSGRVIEQGRFAGDVHNGRRPHYRFTQHGSAYGANIYLVADLAEGGTVHWHIPHGAHRQEY